MPKCRACGGTKVSLAVPSGPCITCEGTGIPSQAVTPTDSQLEKLMDEFRDAVRMALWMNADFGRVVQDSVSVLAARAALREYVASLSSQLERQNARYNRIIEALDLEEPVVRGLQESLEEAQVRASENSESLERLKAEQISAESAKALLDYAPNEHTTFQRTDGAALRLGISALRRLSQSDTGAQP